ncbi:dihydroorotate dehydrogenase [Kosmotoga arenicorallina S304]|uniref:Dihydroorotate dehydrogenase n=1 Tax=Kosmotoga arenicorallina S304 TaxID=1453497 RepID=A0A176K018_9BACT|nr:sulfide/dihydroorotate dehydrogenase-like FAD/NAD-binding protein [Kosmotoga arenicorallina]OAA29746.1 dihydroorotate dehydrogenase [Kosmotoga arenicorallina S304]
MSHRITKKAKLAAGIYDFSIEHSTLPNFAKPGQFLIIRIDEKGERIPLTIAGVSKNAVRIIVKCVGKSTYKLATLKENDEILEVIGPLGNPSEIDFYGKVCVVGGGVGIAPLMPIIKALKSTGNKITTIIGASTAEQLILLDEIGKMSDELIITTDDGSAGSKGLVTHRLEELLNKGCRFDRIWAIGPTIMMKFVSAIALREEIPCWVSLNPIMVDGTGMCGACRVEVGGEMKFACVDGPEFDGRFVNWNELIKRLHQYQEKEKLSLELFKKEVGDLSWL